MLTVTPAKAEMRTIATTGEYRMGDNDTRTDAKRLALQDAKRLALEEAGTYIESITQVKNFDLTKEEIRAYTAGIVEVTEQATRTTLEGDTTVVRVAVTVKIDTDVVVRQIDALRKNETVKAELLKTRQEAERLREELENKTRELASVKSKTEFEAIAQARREVLTGQNVNSLLTQAWVALARDNKTFAHGSFSSEGLRRARILTEQALALDPSNPAVHGIIGLLLAEEGEGKLEETIAAYRTAMRSKPDDADTHYFLGIALVAKGDVKGAIAQFRTAIRLQPNNANTHYFLGNALKSKGNNVEGAIAAYRAAIRLQPDLEVAYIGLGEALMNMRDWEGAIAAYRAAIRLQPNNEGAHFYLGFALEAKRDWEGAIAAYRAAIRLQPDHANTHYFLGNALRDKGELEGAIAAYRMAIRLSPDDGLYHHDLGAALQAKGDMEGAITAYRTVIRLTPDHAVAHYNLGVVLQAKGDVEGAIASYRTAIRLYPDLRVEAARELREYLRLTSDTPASRRKIEKARAALREIE